MESQIKELEKKKFRNQKNPFEICGIISKIGFVWLLPLFYKGYKFGLSEDDIFPHLKSHDSKLLGEKLEAEWNKEIKLNKKNPSLKKAIVRVFGKEMMFLGLGILVFEFVRMILPLSLSKLLDYFDPNTKMSINQAYFYASLVSLTIFTQLMIIHHTMLHIYHMGMKIRAATTSLIYRKAIRLSKSALASSTVGQMVNLISNDVSRFESCTYHVHNIWIGPIVLIVIVILLYINVGWTGICGVLMLLCFIPFQIWMGKLTSIFRLQTAIKTDERIRLMNEIISGIQVIKMYTWEKPFAKLVEITRRLEMKQIQKVSLIRAISLSFHIYLSRTLIYLCITIYVLTGNKLNATYVYMLTLLYEFLRLAVSHALAQGITQLAEASISVGRIRQFLLFDELDPQKSLMQFNSGLFKENTKETHKLTFETHVSSFNSNVPVGIQIKNASAKWMSETDDNTLEKVNFDVSSGELATVIGKVGSGKSTLLHVILKELPPVEGSVQINGTISYASQEPWLFVGSVRQNILFGQEYDVVKYHEVIRVCALERDLTLFPYGDRTIIGERGISLSGGQRARINLARAIYKKADVYLLDDPLSAVDAHVGKQIFSKCIMEYLKDKCVVLVTHQLQYLKDCKKIYLLNKGRVDHYGTYQEIEQCGKEFTKLLEEFKKLGEEAKKYAEDEEKKRKKSMSASKGGHEENTSLEDPVIEKEGKQEGKVSVKIYKSYFSAGGHWINGLLLIFFFIISQALTSGMDYFLSLWVNYEEMRKKLNVTSTINNTLVDQNLEHSEYSTFQKYFFRVFTEDICFYTYSVLITIVIISITTRSIVFFRYCIRVSINLHNNMFSKIVYATMRFFYTNPSGRILNRFAKDMNLVDENLPITLADTLQIGLMMTGIVAVVAVVTPFMLLPAGVMLIIFYLLRRAFIPTSRDIKRLEAITRSPVYSHLTAALQGLTTIRAFEAQDMLIKQFDDYHNAYSSSYFMFVACTRAFGFYLDLHTVLFTTFLTFGFLFMRTEAFGVSVGLAITQGISLTGWLQYGLRQWSEMENTMTSVERIKEYADVIPEDDFRAEEPAKNWPETGNIQFNKVSLRYAKDEPYVLKNLNFSIKSTEKVGIVGRTGAGKSSMIAALFRLADVDGLILIDNVDSKRVSLNMLRSSISIIPQEPVLFSGTLRKNLDPFDNYNDTVLWSALEEVELKNVVLDLPHGLESKMSEGGSNFSVGQRQLVCLARAIIRKNKILVLDEATANVDPHTDGLIQTTIRKKFSHCTVLTIAHRLHTIMDSDKVLVMDAGRAVEFDHPYTLIKNERGVFSELVKQSGKVMALNLTEIAKKSFNHTNNYDEEKSEGLNDK